jgi:ribosomal protein L37E
MSTESDPESSAKLTGEAAKAQPAVEPEPVEDKPMPNEQTLPLSAKQAVVPPPVSGTAPIEIAPPAHVAILGEDGVPRVVTKPIKQEEAETVEPIILSPAEAEEAIAAAGHAPEEGFSASESNICPVCGATYRVGELACAFCGYVFVTSARTHKFEEDKDIAHRKSWPTGDVLATEQKPITFEIDGQKLTLSISETITVGRLSGIASDILPDVDLSSFNAGELGVSRQHIRLRRRGTLIYVADLDSTNGTLLNGRRLIPEGERLIRSGDELRLGHLKIRVKF